MSCFCCPIARAKAFVKASRWPGIVQPASIDYSRGRIHEHLGDRELAEEFYQRSFRENPWAVYCVGRMAMLYAGGDEPVEVRRIAEKLEWHYTPEHASWLNIAECELSVLRRQCLKARLPDIDTVRQKVVAWQNRRNRLQAKIDWRFNSADARIKLKRLYPVVNVQDIS